MMNPLDHKVWISASDLGELWVGCSCGVMLVSTGDGIDLGDLLSAVERHLQGSDAVTIDGELAST